MPALIILAISVLAGWFTITDARRRGMNARLWGLVVFLTSGLALPIYLMIRRPVLT